MEATELAVRLSKTNDTDQVFLEAWTFITTNKKINLDHVMAWMKPIMPQLFLHRVIWEQTFTTILDRRRIKIWVKIWLSEHMAWKIYNCAKLGRF